MLIFNSTHADSHNMIYKYLVTVPLHAALEFLFCRKQTALDPVFYQKLLA